MRILCLVIISTLVTLSGFSQELKKISKKDRKSSVVEEYYVIKKDRDVKQGEYKKMYEDGRVIETGFYKKNLKDSLWIFYAKNGVDTLSPGFYNNGRQVGPWKIFNSNGEFNYVYNYTTKRICRYNWRGKPNKFKVLTNDGWEDMTIDSPPLMLDGSDPLEIIARNIRYPMRAWKGGIDGEVLVTFIVDSTGRMSNVSLKRMVDPDLDKESLRIFKAVDFNWHPAQLDDKYITVRHTLPVTFLLRK